MVATMQRFCSTCSSQTAVAGRRKLVPFQNHLQPGTSKTTSFSAIKPAFVYKTHVLCRSLPGNTPEDVSDALKADVERFAKNRVSNPTQERPDTSPSPLKEAVDKVLIADFFFVLVILAWFAVALVANSALQSSALLDAWMPLWPLVFQPAIGVLMAGALVSGGIGWLQSQGAEKQ
eukprot:jgi/Chrzof1/7309/Cz02g18200.t1